jgi:hypothetical protein
MRQPASWATGVTEVLTRLMQATTPASTVL